MQLLAADSATAAEVVLLRLPPTQPSHLAPSASLITTGAAAVP